MYFLIIMLGMALRAPQDEPQDMYFNHLNISLGINYKYNGLLYHNIDRVWVVTKVILPKLEDISFPDVKFDADCSFVNKIRDAHPSVKTIIQSMCKSMKPLITLIKQKEKFYETAIQSILKEEIPRLCMAKLTLSLVAQIRILSLLVRDFHTAPRERCPCLFTERKPLQLLYLL